MKGIIIGNGLAGLSAAIGIAEHGGQAVVISADSPHRSQSVLAAGGMNAVLNHKGQQDTVECHLEDTMKSSCGLADEDAVRGMVNAAPKLIEWLDKQGVVFSRDAEGNPDQRPFGGQSKIRTTFSKAGIGRQLIAGLEGTVRRLESEGQVETYWHKLFVCLLYKDNEVIGCRVQDTITGEYDNIFGDTVIAASGGLNGMFPSTTGSKLTTGYVTAQLYHEGVELVNLEMIQYHPTTAKTRAKNILISEAARGQGGRLLVMRDGKPWYFMEELYPEKGNLMTRDIISRTAYEVCVKQGYGQMYLDMTHLDASVFENELKEIQEICDIFLKLNPVKEYIPVEPGVHYFMGGIRVDNNHRTSIPHVYAAGECAGIYHGANRLGGNSTLGAIYGGRLAGTIAAEEASRIMSGEEGKNVITYDEKAFCHEASPALAALTAKTMSIVRDEENLKQGLDELATLPGDKDDIFIELAKAMFQSALERRETRGAHARSDYPEL